MTLAFLVACTIKATVIFILAPIGASLARRRSAALRHQIWAVAMLCAVALPLLAALIPGWNAHSPEAAIRLRRAALPAGAPSAAMPPEYG